MNTKNQKKEDLKRADDRTPQVGALLRASRLRVGEELREVSDVLCIRFLYLEAIEECRYADLPGDTYAVGFIRSYAEHLGLDGDEVVRRYRTEQMGKGNSSELLFPTPVQDSGVPKGAIVFVGFLIALLVYGGWYVTTTDESILSDIISPVPDHLKHLVTGDDASDDQNAESNEAPSDTSAASGAPVDTGSTPTDDTVRASADAAEQIANAAGEVAARTADAARAAAETAAEAVTVEPSSSTQALLSAEQVATDAPAIETTSPASMPETTINETADVSASSAVTTESAQVSETQTAPSTNFSKPVIQPAAEAAPESAPVTTGVAIETVEKVVEEPTATITDTTEVSAEVESAASEAVTENITSPASNEVTAEDLNALVLRQATSADEQATVTTSNTTASLSGVSIHATSRSWVEVRDPSNGKILFTGVMSIGSTFDLPDTEGLLLDTGNAGALDITVKGVSVPNIGDIGDVRKSVSLDAERLKAGTATNR